MGVYDIQLGGDEVRKTIFLIFLLAVFVVIAKVGESIVFDIPPSPPPNLANLSNLSTDYIIFSINSIENVFAPHDIRIYNVSIVNNTVDIRFAHDGKSYHLLTTKQKLCNFMNRNHGVACV